MKKMLSFLILIALFTSCQTSKDVLGGTEIQLPHSDHYHLKGSVVFNNENKEIFDVNADDSSRLNYRQTSDLQVLYHP